MRFQVIGDKKDGFYGKTEASGLDPEAVHEWKMPLLPPVKMVCHLTSNEGCVTPSSIGVDSTR